jgi:hypothetical protein
LIIRRHCITLLQRSQGLQSSGAWPLHLQKSQWIISWLRLTMLAGVFVPMFLLSVAGAIGGWIQIEEQDRI